MQLQFASISLFLASMASATSFSSMTTHPSSATFTPPRSTMSVPSISLPPFPMTRSPSSTHPSSTGSSITRSSSPAALNPADYDCVYRGMGCHWTKSEFGYGNDYCGHSPYKAGQKLKNSVIVAVSKDGSGDCWDQAGPKCCQALAESACKRGEKYLECYKS